MTLRRPPLGSCAGHTESARTGDEPALSSLRRVRPDERARLALHALSRQWRRRTGVQTGVQIQPDRRRGSSNSAKRWGAGLANAARLVFYAILRARNRLARLGQSILSFWPLTRPATVHF